MGRRQGGLYTLQPPNAAVFSTSQFDLWHWRLGNPSNSHLKDLAKSNNDVFFSSICPCHVCPLAKQTRLPFPRSSVSTNNPSNLVHCDIWGPYSTPSLNGAHYFLTIADDFKRRSTWLYLML